MKKREKIPIVFFNASVILSGLNSPTGGSAKLLKWTKDKKIDGVISEIVLDETVRHAKKINSSEEKIKKQMLMIFSTMLPAPTALHVAKYSKLVIDQGDAHVLASSYEVKAKFLVTLDKKHLLILQKKIKSINIVSPKLLIEQLSN